MPTTARRRSALAVAGLLAVGLAGSLLNAERLLGAGCAGR